jgi:hypothetical protein
LHLHHYLLEKEYLSISFRSPVDSMRAVLIGVHILPTTSTSPMKKRKKTRCDDWEPSSVHLMDMIGLCLSHVEYGQISQEKVLALYDPYYLSLKQVIKHTKMYLHMYELVTNNIDRIKYMY